MNPNFEAIGKAFIEQYYKLFDSNRGELKPFYVRNFLYSLLFTITTYADLVDTCNCFQNGTDFVVVILEARFNAYV